MACWRYLDLKWFFLADHFRERRTATRQRNIQFLWPNSRPLPMLRKFKHTCIMYEPIGLRVFAECTLLTFVTSTQFPFRVPVSYFQREIIIPRCIGQFAFERPVRGESLPLILFLVVFSPFDTACTIVWHGVCIRAWTPQELGMFFFHSPPSYYRHYRHKLAVILRWLPAYSSHYRWHSPDDIIFTYTHVRGGGGEGYQRCHANMMSNSVINHFYWHEQKRYLL